jgi:hypothetical protein
MPHGYRPCAIATFDARHRCKPMSYVRSSIHSRTKSNALSQTPLISLRRFIDPNPYLSGCYHLVIFGRALGFDLEPYQTFDEMQILAANYVS